MIANPMEDFAKVIGCKNISGYALDYGYFGYKLSIFVDDNGLRNKREINPMATLLYKGRNPIVGNCIIMDDEKELSLQDLDKLVKIAKIIPSHDWMPEPLIEKFDNTDLRSTLSDPCYWFMLETYESALAIGTKEERMKIWDQVKEYYVESDHQ